MKTARFLGLTIHSIRGGVVGMHNQRTGVGVVEMRHKRVEYKLAAQMLKMASEEFSNHGCNDFSLPNTPENRAFLESAEEWNANGDEPYELNISKDQKHIYTMDWFLMDYLAYCLERAEND